MGRKDSIWICNSNNRILLTDMYKDYRIRPVLRKSRQYYGNAFRTAVSCEDFTALKKALQNNGK